MKCPHCSADPMRYQDVPGKSFWRCGTYKTRVDTIRQSEQCEANVKLQNANQRAEKAEYEAGFATRLAISAIGKLKTENPNIKAAEILENV